MKKFAVYQSHKPATKHHHGFPSEENGWDNCVFDSLEEAVKYAQNWCGPHYPVVPDNAQANELFKLPFEAIDGTTEYIYIKSYETCVHTEHCCDVCRICKYGEEETGCPCCYEVPIPATHGCNCDY